jgi:type IV pilus assembly protein PilM
MTNLNIDLQRFSLARMAALWRGEGMLHWKIFQPRYPPLAVEVGEDCLHLAHLERTKDKEKKLILRRYGRVDLPEGSLQPRFGERNVLRPAEVARALLNALERESIETRAISIVLPDHLARTSLLHLGERLGGREEVLDVIKWKLRKAVPFKVEDAHIDYQIFPSPSDGGSHLCQAVLMLRSVLDSYEGVMTDVGFHAGLLDLSTFSLVNLCRPVLERIEEDAFLLNVTGAFFALMILRQGVPIFYRAKSYTFADHADSRRAMVVREVDSSLSYYRERLGGKLPAQIHLRCIDIDLNTLQEELAARVDGSVLPVDPTQVVEVEPRSSDAQEQRDLMQRIAPALGAALGRQG